MLRCGDRPFHVEDVETGAPGPRDVLARVVSAGICHSDPVARATWSAGRPGRCALAGAGSDSLTILPSSLAGRLSPLRIQGHANPPVFIPELIRLRQRGTFPLEAINEAEAASTAGTSITPVLLMNDTAAKGESDV